MAQHIYPDLTPGQYRITEFVDDYVNWTFGTESETLFSGIEGDSFSFTVSATDTYILTYTGSSGGSSMGWRLEKEETVIPSSLFAYPSIVPAAVSSELDVSGEERIHIAPYADEVSEAPTSCSLIMLQPYGCPNVMSDYSDMPSWFSYGETFGFIISFNDMEVWMVYDGDSDQYKQQWTEGDPCITWEDYEQVYDAQIKEITEGSPPSSCAKISTYTPA